MVSFVDAVNLYAAREFATKTTKSRYGSCQQRKLVKKRNLNLEHVCEQCLNCFCIWNSEHSSQFFTLAVRVRGFCGFRFFVWFTDFLTHI